MLKKTLIPLLLLGAFLLWGCPYESEVPIDEPAIPVNKGWFGLWKMAGEEKSYASLTPFAPKDTLNYRLVYNLWPSEQNAYEVNIFKAFLSKINESFFINIQPQMKMGGDYYLFGIQCNATMDTLRLWPVNGENAPNFTNSPSLREWLSGHMKSKDFYDAQETFIRVKQ